MYFYVRKSEVGHFEKKKEKKRNTHVFRTHSFKVSERFSILYKSCSF